MATARGLSDRQQVFPILEECDDRRKSDVVFVGVRSSMMHLFAMATTLDPNVCQSDHRVIDDDHVDRWDSP